MNFKSALSLILFVLLLIIAFQNMETIVIQILFWGVTAPLLIILLSVFLMGLLVGLMLGRRGGKERTEDRKQESDEKSGVTRS